MTIVALSDSHGNHRSIDLPVGEIAIHCGDCTRRSNNLEILDFIQWFSDLQFNYKILVAGNHDRFIQKRKEEFYEMLKNRNIIYLENRAIQIAGVNFFGSPYTMNYGGTGAFTYKDEHEANQLWNLIPENTDILITHGPPKGYRDYSKAEKRNTGCQVLLTRVLSVRPRYHIFGHIHESYGTEEDGGTSFVNASIVNGAEEAVNKPVQILLDY